MHINSRTLYFLLRNTILWAQRSRVAVNRTGLTRRLAGEHPDHKQQHSGKWQKRVQQTCQRHSKTPWEPPYSIAGIALGPYDT